MSGRPEYPYYGNQRIRCRHCGHWMVVKIDGKKRVVVCEFGEQLPIGGHGGRKCGRTGADVLRDPKINTIRRVGWIGKRRDSE